MKRNLAIGIGIVLAGFIAVWFFLKQEKVFFKDTSLYRAVPLSVPVFAEVGSLKAIPFNTTLFNRWTGAKSFSEFNKWMIQLDSVIRDNRDIQKSLRSSRFLVAFGLMGDNELTPLIIQKAESNGRKKSVINLVKTLYPEPEFEYTEFDYAGSKIISGNTANNRKSINFCFASDLLIASPNLVLVQQSLLQLSDQGIISNPSFKKLTDTFNEEPEISVFINHKLFPDVLLELVNSSSFIQTNEFDEEIKRNHYRNFREFRKFASWSQLKVKFNEHDILLEGLTVANDTINDFLEVFENQAPLRINAGEKLPANTSCYAAYSFSDKALFFKNLERFFAHAGSFYKREDMIRKIELGLRVDIRKTFQSMVKSELIVASTEVQKETKQKTTYFILDVNGKSKTEKLLDSVLVNYVNRNDLQLSDIKSEFVLDEENKFDIISFPFPSFPGTWLGKPFYLAEANFAVFYKDLLVFCNTQEGLKDYIKGMKEKNNLSEDYYYQRAMSNIQNKANISTYFSIERGEQYFGEILDSRFYKKLQKNKDILQTLKCISWNIGADKEAFFNQVNLILNSGAYEAESSKNGITTGRVLDAKGNQIGWQCNIGSQLITKPYLAINHDDEDNRDILIQDKKNKLHQISSKGNINWSIDIVDEIISEIFQVDYQANGELQYLFSTKRKLFLVDREGKMVDGFPVEFPTIATAGVNVFDYDNNRIYRYFVPCRDKKVYVYDKHGKIVEGWNFEGTKSQVNTPVQHYRIKGKDFIVLKDEEHIYILNRRGETVVKPELEIEYSENLLFLAPGENPQIVFTDEKGKIFKMNFDGNYEVLNFGKFDDDHHFIVEDINGKGTPEYIFAEGKDLTVFKEDGTVLFTKKFKGKIEKEPGIYNFGGGQKKIGVVIGSTKRIYLIDAAGEFQTGFPLPGATEFSIGKINSDSKNLILLVGSSRGSLIKYDLD